MAAEINGLIYGFHNAYVAQHMLQQLFTQHIPLDIYIVCRTVFYVIAKHSSTNEKRLQIDISAIREAHDKKIIRSISWIPSSQNLADAMTKATVADDHVLLRLLTTNKLTVNPVGWVSPMQQ